MPQCFLFPAKSRSDWSCGHIFTVGPILVKEIDGRGLTTGNNPARIIITGKNQCAAHDYFVETQIVQQAALFTRAMIGSMG